MYDGHSKAIGGVSGDRCPLLATSPLCIHGRLR